MRAPLLASLGVLLVASVAGCAADPPRPDFRGLETDTWTAYDIDVTGMVPRRVVDRFEYAAHAYGCSTRRLGRPGIRHGIEGENSHWRYAVEAVCDDGTVTLVPLTNGSVRVGCEKPSSRPACDALLAKISGV